MEIVLQRTANGLRARPLPGREEGKVYADFGKDQDGNTLLVELTPVELDEMARRRVAHEASLAAGPSEEEVRQEALKMLMTPEVLDAARQRLLQNRS